MKSQAVATAISLLFVIGSTGCSSSSNPSNAGAGGSSNVGGGAATGGSGGGASTVPVTCPSFTKDTDGNYEISGTAESNYGFMSAVTLGATQTVKAKTDVTFNWSALNEDMFGQAMDPKTDVGNVAMLLLHMTKQQLQDKINDDSFNPLDRVGAATYLTGGTITQASTDKFGLLGQPLDHGVLMSFMDEVAYPLSDYTYMVMVGSGNVEGKNARMLGSFAVSASATNTEVTIGPESATCDYHATLDALKPVVMPKSTSKIMFDWSTLTKSAAGRTVDFVQITRVLVASFTQPVAELQKNENFLNLEKLAVDKWSTQDLAGTTVSFSILKNEKDQSAFSGFDSSHTWIIALENQDALNPAPWYMTVVQPCQ